MITCPECQATYPNGTLVCRQDGHVFAPPVHAIVYVGSGVQLPSAVDKPIATLEIVLEEVSGRDLLKESAQVSFTFGLETAGNPPLRIGRKDDTTNPPIVPEIDLLPFLNGLEPERTLSRIQAAIEQRSGKPHLRTLSDRHTTYHRRTGTPKARPLMSDQYVELQDYDIIYIGNPKRDHIRLRIRILHP